ncbi:putative c2h2 finger domain-containing protein [Zalerion maritima]|uniref:C2h2 finger domain-containing protein n=1 Tax=Zalerion maritima TaxID=339359 RepID=A0AAD5S0V8_9PEZI|nr:putative c2h2 finger domain-containing protein [Zalerion maritima]
MTDKKGGAYGQAADDTDFRKNWDLDEYAAKGKAREEAEKEERKARYEAKLAGKKYYKPLDGTETLTTARRSAFDAKSRIGTHQLVASGNAIGKRGRGAGFYCEACDLTFKDNKQWIEHTNSIQHLRATGQTAQVKRASVEEVHQRIMDEWEKIQARQRDAGVQLDERLKIRAEEEAKEREEKRVKKVEAREKKKEQKALEEKAKADYGDDVRNLAEHDEEDMMAAMGFTGFGGSSK